MMLGPGYGPVAAPVDADVLVSFGYRHIIPDEVIDSVGGRCFNVHISVLPWNRGAAPNLWAWYDGTPHGVTIHQVDSGIDTGPVVTQREVHLPDTLTLRSSYAWLKSAARAMLLDWTPRLLSGHYTTTVQAAGGSFHTTTQSEQLLARLPQGYDTPVGRVRDVSSAG